MVRAILLRLLTLLVLILPSARAYGQPHEARPAEAAGATVEQHGRKHEVIEFDAATSIWVLIIFSILLIVLYPTAWKNVLAGLKKREQRIRKDIADAEAARAKADETLRQYNAQLASAENRVQEMLAKAVTDGERLATSIRMNAQEEAEEAKERAQRDIEASKNQAISEINEYAVDLATNMAEKILQRSVTAGDQRELVARSLEQMKGLSKN